MRNEYQEKRQSDRGKERMRERGERMGGGERERKRECECVREIEYETYLMVSSPSFSLRRSRRSPKSSITITGL